MLDYEEREENLLGYIINPNKVQKLRNKIYRVGRKIIRKCLKKKMNTFIISKQRKCI